MSYLPPQCIASGTWLAFDKCLWNELVHFDNIQITRGQKYVHFPPRIYVVHAFDVCESSIRYPSCLEYLCLLCWWSRVIQGWPVRAFYSPSHSDLFSDPHVIQGRSISLWGLSSRALFWPLIKRTGEPAWEWSPDRGNWWELERATPSFGDSI